MRMYGHRACRGVFTNIHPSRVQVRMCGDEPVVALDVVEDPDRDNWRDDVPYWGWEDEGKPGEWHMVFHHITLLRVCFPYGLEAAEAHDRGRRVHLLVAEAT